MKIKTLFVCFLAVCAISLSSCKKEKETPNYAEKFVGTYEMTMTPEIQIPIGDGSQAVEPITGMTCTIEEKSTKNDVTVTVNMPEVDGFSMPIVFDATCEESGMNIKEKQMNMNVPLEMFGVLGVDITLAPAHVAVPVDNKIEWSSDATLSLTIEGFPLSLSGVFKFEGTKK